VSGGGDGCKGSTMFLGGRAYTQNFCRADVKETSSDKRKMERPGEGTTREPMYQRESPPEATEVERSVANRFGGVVELQP